MPTGKLRNLCYRAALPFLAPSLRAGMTHITVGRPLKGLPAYEKLLKRHRVFGASLLLSQGQAVSRVYTSTLGEPVHTARQDTMFRVASITKMATALVTLMLVDEGLFALDTPVAQLLPEGDAPALRGVTVRHLLSHTSGLRDIPAVDSCLAQGLPYTEVLKDPQVHTGAPGAGFAYCNFGFGLLGCVLEAQSGQTVSDLFRERLFEPLGMCATLDASSLDRMQIMPIIRVLPYHPGHETVVTALGAIPLTQPDPMRHFGHTAGAMYTEAVSLDRLLSLVAGHGRFGDRQLLSQESAMEMVREQAVYGPSSPTLSYGLGLQIIRDPALSTHRILGHQGFAYGCVDGAFYEEGADRHVIFLNGGCSEARTGKMGLCNRDLLRWALHKELPAWK